MFTPQERYEFLESTKKYYSISSNQSDQHHCRYKIHNSNFEFWFLYYKHQDEFYLYFRDYRWSYFELNDIIDDLPEDFIVALAFYLDKI